MPSVRSVVATGGGDVAEYPRFIHEFLNELLDNEELSVMYDSDPVAAMTEYGLDERQQDLLLNHSNQEVRKELKREMKTHVAYVIRM
jgi:hypothetical protein